ncbi:MAG: allophycocyanin [Pleurocapsa sp.]
MLKQITKLTIEADGRYATDQELKFLKDYLDSVDLRISAYKKISEKSEQVLDLTKRKMDVKDSQLFVRGSKNLSSIWRRDVAIVLRCSVAAMLINDLDWLRDSLLLWHRTIVNANKTEHISEATYRVMPEVIKEYLTDEEMRLILPVLQLDQSILSS